MSHVGRQLGRQAVSLGGGLGGATGAAAGHCVTFTPQAAGCRHVKTRFGPSITTRGSGRWLCVAVESHWNTIVAPCVTSFGRKVRLKPWGLTFAIALWFSEPKL